MAEASQVVNEAAPVAAISIVHLRAFKPLSVAFPAPGVYRQILLVLPPLEPSILARLSPSGGEPLTLMLDFGCMVSAAELLKLIRHDLILLREIHSGAASPFNRSIYARLRLTEKHPEQSMGALVAAQNPLDSVPELKNGGYTPPFVKKRPIYRKDFPSQI